MAVPRINIKSIDYFKFKKLVIDGNRDDYNSCSKEVKSLCDCVQTLNFRDEEFDDEGDRDRFDDICTYYKDILQSKRIDPLDMRIKSGWWGDHKNAYSAGKIKPGALKDALVSKAKQWTERHGGVLAKMTDSALTNKLDGPGLYVFKHKDHQCFQFVGRADKVFVRVAEKLKAAFDGSLREPLSALLVISMMNDWDFYFIPVQANDDERVPRVLENDLILKHDCIWPHGLNFRLHIDSLLEVSEFRKSCLRHSWPPDADAIDGEIDLGRLRSQISAQPMEQNEDSQSKPQAAKPEPKPAAKPAKKGQPPPGQVSPDKSPENPTPTPRPESKSAFKPVGKKSQVARSSSPSVADGTAEAKPEPRYAGKQTPKRNPPSQRPTTPKHAFADTPARQEPKASSKVPPKKPPRPPTPDDLPIDLPSASDSESPDGIELDLGERPSSSLSAGTYVLDSSDSESPQTTKIPVIDSEPMSPKQTRPATASKKKRGGKEAGNNKSTERPKSTTPKKSKPTTPKRSPKLSPEELPVETENDRPESINLGEFENVIVRSVSGTSLTSLTLQSDFDENNSNEVPILPESPSHKSSKARPSSGKSRLPVAASGPLRHQNRD